MYTEMVTAESNVSKLLHFLAIFTHEHIIKFLAGNFYIGLNDCVWFLTTLCCHEVFVEFLITLV